MNLITDAWIPALRLDGTRELFGLGGLFVEADKIRDLALKPHERIAVMRLLLCIAQAALDGPADEADWESCWGQIQNQVQSYLGRWEQWFEMFAPERRFLQIPSLKKGKEADEGNAISKLDLALASGNNSTLFDNTAGGDGRSIESWRTAVNLLAFQCFSPGGRIGIAIWNGKETKGKGSSNHAPCTPSSMVHTFIMGPTILDTIRLNLLTRDCVGDVYGPDGWGRPIWELPITDEGDKIAIRNATMTYLGRLTPLSRAIRLDDKQGGLVLANGVEYPTFPVFREPTATVLKRKEELAVLPASTGRGIWRQLSAISVKRRSGNDPAGGPLALSHVSSAADATVWVGALITDKAKIEDLLESIYVLPAKMFSELGRIAYEQGVAHAEEEEQKLNHAVKIHASALKLSPVPYDRARQHYWTYVEQSLDRLFEIARNPDLTTNMAESPWGQAVNRAAIAAYEQACARQTARQLQAYVEGLRRLDGKPRAGELRRKGRKDE